MVWSYIDNRRVFTTEEGYLGLGPDHFQIRDIVCILLGGAVPLVLRQKGENEFELI